MWFTAPVLYRVNVVVSKPGVKIVGTGNNRERIWYVFYVYGLPVPSFPCEESCGVRIYFDAMVGHCNTKPKPEREPPSTKCTLKAM